MVFLQCTSCVGNVFNKWEVASYQKYVEKNRWSGVFLQGLKFRSVAYEISYLIWHLEVHPRIQKSSPKTLFSIGLIRSKYS